ncbi:energy transducer TonB [Marinomonas rhizomae]|uniref:energy transducer TonB n=1 Tax=Marinomonas rhizomae TaxID=491948 RepID=UPI00210525F5|nr:energy transducer TonB [Marinomonas rhizomae]UTV99846.1 energy transducer TonB [Marinomonas rhizomae]
MISKLRNLFKWSLMLFAVQSISACAGFNRSIDVQNDYSSEVDFTDAPKLYLAKNYSPTVTRGILENEFSAFVPEGVYVPIFKSKGRTFYQAPEGFEYIGRGKVESLVGGLVQVESGQNEQLYVWFFPKQPEYFEIQENGEWVKDIKPGILNILGRPWVEEDLLIRPSEADKIIYSSTCIDLKSLDSAKKKILMTDIFGKLQPLFKKYYQYPSEAREKGIEGKVTVKIVLGESGIINKYRISESSGYKVLDDITLQTFKKVEAEAKVKPLVSKGICFNEGLILNLPVMYSLR